MTVFYKLSGAGNDFVALAEPPEAPGPERIRAWCRRGISLGADGLFTLRRRGEAVVMDYWNADGWPADLCLNGTRCAAQLAFQLGWAAASVRIETPAGPVEARRLDASRVALEIPAPREPAQELTVEAAGRNWRGWALTVGVPHFVLVSTTDLETAPVAEAGPPLRHAAVFPAGANVDWVRFTAPDRMEIRTYERGVEDETLACGSGVVAGAAVGLELGLARLPLAVATRGGYVLELASAGAGTPLAGTWTMAGDARVVARGELLPEAELEPPPSSPSAIM
jgi:diaminopimelate epimerase